jgi:hypothetical protein
VTYLNKARKLFLEFYYHLRSQQVKSKGSKGLEIFFGFYLFVVFGFGIAWF